MDWRSYYYGFARHAAQKSKDSTQVGAVLVGPEGEIRLTGFNGPPRGVVDSDVRRTRPTKYLFASHAEANLIAFAAREGIRTKDCTVYVTHAPCAACARTLIQAGIKEIVVGTGAFGVAGSWSEENEAAAAMCREAGVKVINFVCQEAA
ncbi:dCMP deaminase family protein [Mesorhizobium sp. M4B.F.Ca.ET.058.02.1.1]|uniref:deoxycytidylate deaminase n=1 Tax=Mesorhizobium sp. M4B.F.Ca.ET.058.02.1.1 TaxID=2493675 RepID=UPI000F75F4FE|nr:dCMP deaminase family protein [Mesorhizobium sp. M4B.F.Ca.ET.058.02.1.1]AZO48020.1 dCMP deaminase family protein [Mesorhizobium sp. M4B.F.Ca.ET.058.02.1.1]TJX67552.1 MAG: dCMP deaminase family protein [Mesorhizobium sp.]